MKTNFVWIFIIGISIAFSSCEKNDTSPTDAADLSDFTLLATLSSSNARLADSTTTSSSTSSSNKKCKLTEIDVSTLSTTITAYISTNYEGATIERAGKTDKSQVIVQIKKTDGTFAALLFEASGGFVSES